MKKIKNEGIEIKGNFDFNNPDKSELTIIELIDYLIEEGYYDIFIALTVDSKIKICTVYKKSRNLKKGLVDFLFKHVVDHVFKQIDLSKSISREVLYYGEVETDDIIDSIVSFTRDNLYEDCKINTKTLKIDVKINEVLTYLSKNNMCKNIMITANKQHHLMFNFSQKGYQGYQDFIKFAFSIIALCKIEQSSNNVNCLYGNEKVDIIIEDMYLKLIEMMRQK